MNNKTDTFGLIYSNFLLVFGFGIIVCFLVLVALLIYYLPIFLLFLAPLLIGMWQGVFKKESQFYEIELDAKDIQKLNHIISQVINKTGQSNPSKIILSEGSEISVSGLFKKKLTIGLVALRLLDEQDLIAIIGHEYGHFANKDTIFGYFVYRIQYFIELQREICYPFGFIQNNDFEGIIFKILWAILYLPIWLFFFLLSRYFALINLWYSRKIEYLADKFAANLVGVKKYSDALVKYCIISEIFDKIVPQYVWYYHCRGKSIVNVYEFILPIYTYKNISVAFNEVMSENSNWWGTHPSISERLEALGVKSVDIEVSKNNNPLLVNQTNYEIEASKIIYNKIASLSRYIVTPRILDE